MRNRVSRRFLCSRAGQPRNVNQPAYTSVGRSMPEKLRSRQGLCQDQVKKSEECVCWESHQVRSAVQRFVLISRSSTLARKHNLLPPMNRDTCLSQASSSLKQAAEQVAQAAGKRFVRATSIDRLMIHTFQFLVTVYYSQNVHRYPDKISLHERPP